MPTRPSKPRTRRQPAAQEPTARSKSDRHRKADADAMQKVIAAIPPRLARWQRRRKALGLHQRQAVFELHCRQGYDLHEVAEILDISPATVCHHWKNVQDLLAEAAPNTPAQFTAMREQIATRLWTAVEETHCRVDVIDAAGTPRTLEMPITPQMLALRLKALDQLSKLYGVALDRPPIEPNAPALYATPAQLSEEIRQRQFQLHGYHRSSGSTIVTLPLEDDSPAPPLPAFTNT